MRLLPSFDLGLAAATCKERRSREYFGGSAQPRLSLSLSRTHRNPQRSRAHSTSQSLSDIACGPPQVGLASPCISKDSRFARGKVCHPMFILPSSVLTYLFLCIVRSAAQYVCFAAEHSAILYGDHRRRVPQQPVQNRGLRVVPLYGDYCQSVPTCAFGKFTITFL